MPNGVKYSTTLPSGSFKRGNVILGVNANLGPTSTTGFYSMPAPQSGKYIINKVSPSGIPNFFAPANDAELIRLAKVEGATGADTGSAAAVLAWIAAQDNLEAVNFEYESIVTDGLVLNVDAGFVASYPTTGTTWYDLSGNANNGTLTNGPTFNSANSGSIVFDGIDDYISMVGVNSLFEVANATFTVNMWVYAYAIQTRMGLWGKNDAYEFGFISNGSIQFWSPGGNITITVVDNNYLNQWKMITSINSSQGSYIYSNGVLIGSGGQLSGVGGSNFAIGSGFDPPGTNTFNGRISITQIYNRALTETEILQNYNAQKGRFGL